MNSANRHATVTRMKLTGDEHWCDECADWVPPDRGKCPACGGDLLSLDEFTERADALEER